MRAVSFGDLSDAKAGLNKQLACLFRLRDVVDRAVIIGLVEKQSMAKGGKRPGAGRKKGGKNKRSSAIYRAGSELAREYGPRAVKVLAEIMNNTKAPAAARVHAAIAILDRAYGKPQQSVEVPGGMAHLQVQYKSVEEVEAELERRGLGPAMRLIQERRAEAQKVVEQA